MNHLWSNIWAMHDMAGFGHMSRMVPGVSFYCDRSLLIPAPTVVIHENGTGTKLIDDYVDFLRRPDVALGPQRVVTVKGDDLFAGILADPILREQLQRFTMNGGMVQVFCMTERAEVFFREMMIDDRNIDSAPLEISNKMNDKAHLREVCCEIGIPALLDYKVEKEPERIYGSVVRFLEKPITEVPFVVLKRTDLAGGDGFQRVYRHDDIRKKVGAYLRRHHGKKILIEEGHAHEAYSIQMAVRRKRATRQLVPTRQIFDRFGIHYGNTIAWQEGVGNPHPHIDNEDRISMGTWGMMLADQYAKTRIVGYHGTIGFDFIKLKKPKKNRRQLFLLECNGRQTASTYPLAVMQQLEGRGKKSCGIVMLNSVPAKSRTFGELADRLGDLLFASFSGIIPFNVRLMTLNDPHCGIIAVGEDLKKAGAMIEEAKKRLLQ